MANDFYQLYFADVMRLAKTMVIKSDVSAQATNRALTEYGYTIGDDRSTWRYYMNIAGLYHFTNTPMQVISLDTQETIDFTVENLKIHRATARGYAYGSSYYNALLSQYSGQESLILGILNPIDLATAIAADEGQILWMDDSLVDVNEDNLQALIQLQINAYLDRWHVETYSLTEDLYDAARLGILYANLPVFIMTARLKNSHTFRASSFHIRQRLASNGKLDQYMDAMTLKQQLFFYRNLQYLHRYPGRKNTFNWLVQNTLEERDFPLADYTLIQNISNMPTSVTPAVELVRRETTAAYAGVPETKVSVPTLLQKQVKLARSNAKLLEDNTVETLDLMESAKVSQVPTKVLESSVVDMTDSQVYSLNDFLLNHWFYLAAQGRYRAVSTVANPRSGDSIQLQALDAFTLFLYASSKISGMELLQVPTLLAINVLRSPVPTPTQMLDLVGGSHATLPLAQALWDLIPPLESYISTASFYEAVKAVHEGALDQYNLASYQHNFQTRADAESMASYMFMDIPISLGNGESYADWLAPRGLSGILDLSDAELTQLSTSLMATATGLDLNTSLSLNDIHRAMIGIMQRLSSYSVHYVREINDQPLRPMAHRWIRPGDSSVELETEVYGDILSLRLVESAGTELATGELETATLGVMSVETGEVGDAFMGIGLEFERQQYRQNYSEMEMSMLRMLQPVERPITDLSGLTTTSDVVVTPLAPSTVLLGQLIYNRTLSGLNPPSDS